VIVIPDIMSVSKEGSYKLIADVLYRSMVATRESDVKPCFFQNLPEDRIILAFVFVRGDPLEGAIPYAFYAKLGVPYLCLQHNPQPQVLVADCSSLPPKLFPQTSDEAYQFTRDSWWARPDSNRRPSGLSPLWL